MSLNNPFESKKDLIFHLANEFILLIFYCIILTKLLNIFTLSHSSITVLCVRIIFSALGFNIVFNIYQIINKIVLVIRSRKSFSRVIPLEVAETGNPLKDKNIQNKLET